jgi:hypothetical protein
MMIGEARGSKSKGFWSYRWSNEGGKNASG